NWTWSPDIHRTIAFPAPGPNPQPPTRLFTVHPATGHSYDEQTRVRVVQAGVEVQPAVNRLETGFGTTMLEIVLDRTPGIDERVDIEVTDIDTATGRVSESYTSWFVTCP